MDDVTKMNPWLGWTIEKELGRGNYGAVYSAVKEWPTESRRAIKVIYVPIASKSDWQLMVGYYKKCTKEERIKSFSSIIPGLTEISAMEKLNGHANIVSIEDSEVIPFEDHPGFALYIRMPLLTPLEEWLAHHAISEKCAVKLGKDLCSALIFCEEKDIIHRDIKPDNIFEGSGSFKLGDFGVSRVIESNSCAGTCIGTKNYMAPEVANEQPYDRRADIYSLGLVLYWLLNKQRLPFWDTCSQEEAYAKRKGGEELPPPCGASDKMMHIILKACAFKPKDRFQTPEEMRTALESLENDAPAASAPPVTTAQNNISDAFAAILMAASFADMIVNLIAAKKKNPKALGELRLSLLSGDGRVLYPGLVDSCVSEDLTKLTLYDTQKKSLLLYDIQSPGSMVPIAEIPCPSGHNPYLLTRFSGSMNTVYIFERDTLRLRSYSLNTNAWRNDSGIVIPLDKDEAIMFIICSPYADSSLSAKQEDCFFVLFNSQTGSLSKIVRATPDLSLKILDLSPFHLCFSGEITDTFGLVGFSENPVAEPYYILVDLLSGECERKDLSSLRGLAISDPGSLSRDKRFLVFSIPCGNTERNLVIKLSSPSKTVFERFGFLRYSFSADSKSLLLFDPNARPPYVSACSLDGTKREEKLFHLLPIKWGKDTYLPPYGAEYLGTLDIDVFILLSEKNKNSKATHLFLADRSGIPFAKCEEISLPWSKFQCRIRTAREYVLFLFSPADLNDLSPKKPSTYVYRLHISEVEKLVQKYQSY